MTSNGEDDDKITVLFPDRDGEESAETEESPEDEESPDEEAATDDDAPAESPDSDPEPDEAGGAEDSEAAGEGDDNVVRLDFQNKQAGSDADTETGAEHSLGELPSDEAVDADRAKFEVFRRMIEEGMVMVTLDTRIEGVEVPPKFEGLPELRLNFSHMFHIDDFDYDSDGVRASLSFDGTRYFCDVPWESVFMLYSHESGDVVVFEPTESPEESESSEDSGDSPEE